MHEHPTQSELSIRGRPLLECQRVEVEADHIRVYYIPQEPTGSGFDFFVAEFSAGYGVLPKGEPYMDRPDTQVECLFHGVAYFDGLRHLYMGEERSDNVGYLYYANPDALAKVFQALGQLEREHCRPGALHSRP